jgi:hypothetical protein
MALRSPGRTPKIGHRKLLTFFPHQFTAALALLQVIFSKKSSGSTPTDVARHCLF